MYDAKNIEENETENLKYSCLYERAYFKKIQSESLLNTKSSYVPIENVVKID